MSTTSIVPASAALATPAIAALNEPFALDHCNPRTQAKAYTPRCTRPAWKPDRITLIDLSGRWLWVRILSAKPGRKYVGLIIDGESDSDSERVAFTHTDIIDMRATVRKRARLLQTRTEGTPAAAQ